LKKRLARRYQLEIAQIVLSFDGDTISEEDTPEGLDLEEGYLLDVKVCFMVCFSYVFLTLCIVVIF